MFTYEEMLSYCKEYKYSYDYDKKTTKLIKNGDREKKELPKSPETDKIKAALLVKNILDHCYPKGTEEDKKNGFKELQEEIIKATTDGHFTFSKVLFQKKEVFETFMDDTFLTNGRNDDLINKDKISRHTEEDALAFINLCLLDVGKKIDKVEVLHSANDITRNFNFKSRDLSFSEKLNPNNPTYTQQPKMPSLSPEQIQRRREFVDNIMQAYKECETDKNYKDRANREEADMNYVVKSINSNSIINGITGIKRLMDLLYAARNVSLIGEKDYLSAIINQPQISSLLLKMRDGNALDIMTQKAEERKNSGNTTEHKPTYGETAIKRANELISEHPTAVEVAKRQLLGKNTFQINNGDLVNLRRAQLVEIVARIQGKSISRTTDQQGNRILQVDDGMVK